MSHPHSMSRTRSRPASQGPQHALLSVEVIDWIGSPGINDLTDVHSGAGVANSTGRVTNAMLQAWGIDRISAGNALRGLVERNVALPSGGRRYGVTAPGTGNQRTPQRPEYGDSIVNIRSPHEPESLEELARVVRWNRCGS